MAGDISAPSQGNANWASKQQTQTSRRRHHNKWALLAGAQHVPTRPRLNATLPMSTGADNVSVKHD